MDLRNLIRINKNLPKPKQKVIGNHSSLNFTSDAGFRIEIDKKTQHTIRDWLIIDGKTIYFGIDKARSYLNHHVPEESLVIGDGLILRRHASHDGRENTNNFISSPWSRSVWHTEYPNKSNKMPSRQGWCCTMQIWRPYKDLICEHLMDDVSIFDINHYFCYDFYRGPSQDIKKFMFRSPIHNGDDHNEEHLEEARKSMIVTNPSETSHMNPGDHLGPWHNKCIIELVAETLVAHFFVTERTVKPIAAGMPFVIVACHKFLYRLRKMGFKTFHPYIDESYDLEISMASRVEMAVKSFSNFAKNPQNFEQIQRICDHNRQILHKIRAKHTFNNRIWRKLRRFITVD